MAGALLGEEVDGGVDVDVFAVFELLELAEGLRLEHLELALGLVDEAGVLLEGLLVELVGALFDRLLADGAPAGLVVVGAEVPLVVVEELDLGRGRRRGGVGLFHAVAVLLVVVRDRGAGLLLEVLEEGADRGAELVAVLHHVDFDATSRGAP